MIDKIEKSGFGVERDRQPDPRELTEDDDMVRVDCCWRAREAATASPSTSGLGD